MRQPGIFMAMINYMRESFLLSQSDLIETKYSSCFESFEQKENKK